jgi:hypothetical protein
MFLISVFILRGFGQEFLSGGIVKYNAKTNTITKEIDLRLSMGNLVQADDGLFYGLVHSDSSDEMMLFSYDHLTKEYVGKKLIDARSTIYDNLGLIKGNDGLLYGYTRGGGKYNQGFIFSFDPFNSVYSNCFDFGPDAPANTAFSHFTQGKDDLFYGFGYGGGQYGSLISINLKTHEYNILHVFTANEGSNAIGKPLLATDGLIYGMLGHGPGYQFAGSLISFDPLAKDFKVRFKFEGPNGAWPYGSLIQAKNGKLYGTTAYGYYSGTVFSYDPVTDIHNIIENFEDAQNGGSPHGTLAEASDGLLYGIAGMGGMIFSVDPVAGTYTERIVLDSISASYAPGNQLIEIKPIIRSTSLIYSGKTSVQYSDKIMLSALLQNSKNNQPVSGMNVSFRIGERTLNATTNAGGIAQAEIQIERAPGVISVYTEFTGNEHYQPSFDKDEITIIAEDARANYTGVLNASTLDLRSDKARVTLSATIRDISSMPADPFYDKNKGDIRNAVLSFINLGTNSVIGTAPVQSFVKGDSTIGTAVYLWDVDLGMSGSRTYNIALKITGYYQYTSASVSIKVSKATEVSMTGGGTVNGADGKYQFNLNLSQSHQGIRSNVGLKIRQGMGGSFDISRLHFYSFDASHCSDATINATGRVISGTGRDGFTSYENAILQWEVSNAGKSRSEQIKITAWRETGGLIFSTNWNGIETNWSGINGNIGIDGCDKKLNVRQDLNSSAEEAFLAVKVYPNPSQTLFNIQLSQGFGSEVRIRVTDLSGRVIEELKVVSGSLIQIGHHYRPGMYIAELNSGDQRKQVRLFKAGN